MDRNAATDTIASLEALHALGLLKDHEWRAVRSLITPDSPWGDYVDASTTLHIHCKVASALELPINAFFDAGARLDHQKVGFSKFRFPGGLNAIFSEPRITVEDAGVQRETPTLPYLDHIGFDLRESHAINRGLFDHLIQLAEERGIPRISQGGEGRSVACCYAQVEAKHWLFPNEDSPLAGIALEFALGPITHTPDTEGDDHRPEDPGEGAKEPSCCG